MWQEIIDQKNRWIGGRLIDFGDYHSPQRYMPAETIIKEINLTSDYFEVVGTHFTCGGNRAFLGLNGSPAHELPKNGLAFIGYGGHEWCIVPKEEIYPLPMNEEEEPANKKEDDSSGFLAGITLGSLLSQSKNESSFEQGIVPGSGDFSGAGASGSWDTPEKEIYETPVEIQEVISNPDFSSDPDIDSSSDFGTSDNSDSGGSSD